MRIKDIVVLCIGSEKVCGDMLGPMVGSILTKEYNISCYVYGTLDRSVNGLNLDIYERLISNLHKESVVIAVDAAVGSPKDIGKVKLKGLGVNAGGAMGLDNLIDGIGVVGVVAEKSGSVIHNLMIADFYMVEKMSRKIALMLFKVINQVVKPFCM